MRIGFLRTAAVGVMATSATLAATAPAYASGEWIEVKPSTVQAGFAVTVTANCGDNLTPAKISSEAFGEQLAVPRNGLLSADMTVSKDKKPGSFLVKVNCPNGRVATTKLHVLAMAAPPRGPDTGGGGLAGGINPGQGLLVAGLATLAAGGVLGFVRMRRRRAMAPNYFDTDFDPVDRS